MTFVNSLSFRRDAIVSIPFLVIGVSIVKAPVVAWALVDALLGLLLFQFPAYAWVSAAALAAVLSRGFVATGLVPNIVNFFHFPLALGAAFVAATRGASRGSIARSTAIGLGVLFFLSFISWAFNSGELLRPLLDWLVFSEPFLLVYALVKMPPPSGREKFLWKLVLGIPFVQFPLALWQALTLGLGDRVQGTFVGMGAGHHVMGAVALTGTLVCVAKGLSAVAFRKRLWWLLSGILLFIVPVLSDAKQNIAAFLPALLLLMSMFVRFQRTGLVITISIFALALFEASSYYSPLQSIADQSLMSEGIRVKEQALGILARRLSDNPWGWLFGVGPGNSVSRVALMGLERYLDPDSPVALLNLNAAPMTREIWGMSISDASMVGSSVFSGISSWLGLLGDIGLVGLGFYLWMSWKLWQRLKKHHGWETAAARAVLVMAGILGIMYSWLEEPGFTLMVALLVGLSLIATEKRDAFVQDLDRPQLLPAGWR